MKTNPYADLPRIIYVERVEDCGPRFDAMDEPAHCPHCGAEGRYIFWFHCEDGSFRGAMKGCFSHFKRHPFADMTGLILTKEREYQAKGWKLAKWDVDTLEAVQAFARGEITEQEAINRIHVATAAKQAWMRKKGYR